MARIRIEDLPVLDKLTNEEMEELFGAGRFSFRPTFEALEAREMMDAGLGHALLPTIAAPQGGATHEAGMVRDFAPTADVGMTRMYSALSKGLARGGAAQESLLQIHANRLRDDAATSIDKAIVAGGTNIWGFRTNSMESTVLESTPTSVKVAVDIKVGHFGYPKDLPTCRFTVTYADFGNRGGSEVYKVTDVKMDNYDGFDPAGVRGKVQNALNHEVALSVFDVNAGRVTNHDKAEGAVLNSIKKWVEGTREWGTKVDVAYVDHVKDGFTATVKFHTRTEHWEVDTNEKFIKHIQGKLTFTFRYEGMANGQEQFTCTKLDSDLQWVCNRDRGPREYHGANLGDFGTNERDLKKAFSTTQESSHPDHVAKAAFTEAQKVLGSHQFTNFKLAGIEELQTGVRLKIQAARADGKDVVFSVDVKYDGAHAYKCDRASIDHHGDFGLSDKEVAALADLPTQLKGNWERPRA